MIDLEKRILLTMLCGWKMSQMLSEQTSRIDQGRFPVNGIWKLLLSFFRHLELSSGIPKDREKWFATSVIR
jgi:hypothetical protein